MMFVLYISLIIGMVACIILLIGFVVYLALEFLNYVETDHPEIYTWLCKVVKGK